jgi:hypothetical protein
MRGAETTSESSCATLNAVWADAISASYPGKTTRTGRYSNIPPNNRVFNGYDLGNGMSAISSATVSGCPDHGRQ